MKIIVEIPETLDSRKKTWRKLLTSVDTTKSSGYAFIGNWLTAGEKSELKIGSYILGYDESGSMKNWYPVIRLWLVTENTEGELKKVYNYNGDTQEKSWALSVRNKIAEIVNKVEEKEKVISKFQEMTDRELIEELERRGYVVSELLD